MWLLFLAYVNTCFSLVQCMYSMCVEAYGVCVGVGLSSVCPHIAKLYKLCHIVIEVHRLPCPIQTQL